MARAIVQRSRKISDLGDEIKTAALATMRGWDFETIAREPQTLGTQMVPALVEAVRPVLARTIEAGAETGAELLAGRASLSTDIDFDQMAEDVFAAAERELQKIAARFVEDLGDEAGRMAATMDARRTVAAIKVDWERENRGTVSGQLWSRIPRLLSALVLQIFNTAQYSAMHGQTVKLDGA